MWAGLDGSPVRKGYRTHQTIVASL